MSYITTDNLGLVYQNDWIFKEINLSIKEHEFISILGPSGCGKSSLLNILAGTLLPNEGHIEIKGKQISGLNNHFAYMPQNDLLFSSKTVKENITLFQKIHHLPVDETHINQLLEQFGLLEVKNAYPEELSGGMRQRVAFLRTVLVDRDTLLLDEPFGALDVFTRNVLQDWLKNIAKELNKTIILVTHDIDEALYLSDRILIMGDKPSNMIAEIDLTTEVQTREWLAKQGERRNHIFQLITNKQLRTKDR